MVLARQKKISVINRSAIKSLRAIMQDDFTESVHTFLDDSLSLHSKLHASIENNDSKNIRSVCSEYADTCSFMGAEILSAKLAELQDLNLKTQLKEVKNLINQIDQLYDLCRVELQTELNKQFKKAV